VHRRAARAAMCRARVNLLRCIVLLAAAVAPIPAAAQTRARVSVDSVAAIDLFQGQGAASRPDTSLDIGLAIRLSDGWMAYVRPWFFQSSQGTDWQTEIYQAALQYSRGGRIATRVDAGYIASPIGLGMLDMRADVNPTIRPHLSYFVPLMPFDSGAPRVGPIASTYPFGAQLSLSTSRWDARMAVVASAPTRMYALHASTPNPRATPVLVAGGGVTPRPGLRLGAAVSAGSYAPANERIAGAAVNRRLAMWTLEGEYAFGHTKVSGEVTHERFVAGGLRNTSATWFIQGTQTLSPRWFVAARNEGISAPPFGGEVMLRPRLAYKYTEATVGYRLSPELTVRGGFFAAKSYTRTDYDQQAGLSLVWSRRWW